MDSFFEDLLQNFAQDNSRVAVRFTDDVSKEGRKELASELGLHSHEEIPLRTRKFTLFTVKSQEEHVLNEAVKQKVVSFLKRVYRSKINPNETLVILPEIVVFGASETIEAAAKLVGGEARVRGDHKESESAVIVLPIDGDLSEAVNLVSEKYPELLPVPNSMSIISKKSLEQVAPSPSAGGVTPGLPQRDNEWYHRIIKAPDAWKLAQGNPAIKIAILDEGVDMNHEDLKNAIITNESFDAIGNDADPSPKGNDAHGTACAGLAAGINNKIGVRGIGSGCSIVPIRIAYSEIDPNTGKSRWFITSSAIAASFDHCVRVHAHVVSNSWGGGSNSGYKPSLDKAINAGLIVVAAAGNDSKTPVSFPARTDGVICVSASNNLDSAKKKNDGSFESWWGTNYGKHVWIAAPGVKMFTTDISGSPGYDPGNYTGSFNGTSSATPIVSGAIGLMLSVKPTLTLRQVKDILRDTADQVGSDSYQNGRNDYMGYGRLNVLEAVKAAIAHP